MLLLAVFLGVFSNHSVRAGEVIFYVDVSNSMNKSAANEFQDRRPLKTDQVVVGLVGLFENWPEADVHPRVILWNDSLVELPLYTPERLANYFRLNSLPTSGLTYLGAAMHGSAQAHCAHYIVLTDLLPKDRRSMEREVGRLLTSSFVTVFVVSHHADADVLAGFRRVSKAENYRVVSLEFGQEVQLLQRAVSDWYQTACQPGM